MNTTASTLQNGLITAIAQQAKHAAQALACSEGHQRNRALESVATALINNRAFVFSENQKDLEQAITNGISTSLIDRLTITDKVFNGMIESLRQVAALPDPIGTIDHIEVRPSGIRLGKMRVPLGVVGMIYESRPNVTQEAAALCIKSGNGCLLRGGSEAIHSNIAIGQSISEGLMAAGLPAQAIQVLPTTDREAVGEMVQSVGLIDVIIPRGGKALIERVSRESRLPVIKHLDGNCHVFVDAHADIDMALSIADNAKTQRYSTCNTMESLLIAQAIANDFLPAIAKRYAAKNVEMRGCIKTMTLLKAANININAACEEDYYTEYLAPIVSIKIVDDINAAITHINHYGSHHTDAIVTNHYPHAMRFLREVDSSSVMVNASTRFADGFEYGLGAEIGISTDKFHARGPVGLEGLTSQKWIVLGQGEIRL